MEKEVVNVLREKDNTHGHKSDDVTLAFIQKVRFIIIMNNTQHMYRCFQSRLRSIECLWYYIIIILHG